MRVAMAPRNSTIGDLERNIKKIMKYTEDAEKRVADLVVFLKKFWTHLD